MNNNDKFKSNENITSLQKDIVDDSKKSNDVKILEQIDDAYASSYLSDHPDICISSDQTEKDLDDSASFGKHHR